MRTNVYIDGFNLYYGCLQRTPYRWLDLYGLAKRLLPSHEIAEVHYFTARVKGDPRAEAHQGAYLRALALTGVTIVEGHFLRHQTRMPNAAPPPATVSVWKTEEKGSDVNLATHLLRDAFRERAEQFLVVTNDSDLATPIRVVRSELQVPVGVALPVSNPGRQPSVQLREVSTFVREIRKPALAAAQLPDSLSANGVTVVKPRGW